METLQNTAFVSHVKTQFLPSATATLATFATVEPSKHSLTTIGTTVLLVALLATCTSPSYANNVKVQQRVNTNNSKVYVRVNSNYGFLTQFNEINQLSFFDSFNCIAKVAVASNNEVLSKSTSVSPQRHCGFFAPVIYSASQAIKCNAKMTTAHLRPKSVYDWMTRPNKPMANKSGGSSRPRVNPVALISQFSVTSHNSKLLGVAHHG